MSFQSFITQQVAALTERLNAIANNAKKIIELPWQSVLRPESEIHVSDAGTSFKIKIQQIFDWFYSIRQNQLLSANISILANEITVASGAQWIIGNVNYSSVSNTSFTIEYAEDGYTRNDILVADKNNQITRVIGPETEGISPTPPTPIDTVLVTIINVTDSTIGSTPPVIGGDYEKVINKQNSLAVDGTGTKYATVDAVNAGIAAIVVPDATTTIKGIVKLAGDLGGTADAPTTPTAVHKTGNEFINGNKTIPNTLANPSSFAFNTGSDAIRSGTTAQTTSATYPAIKVNSSTNGTAINIETTNAGSTGIKIEPTQNNPTAGNMLVLSNKKANNGVVDISTPIVVLRDGATVASVTDTGIINGSSGVFTGNVSGANPTVANHLVTKAFAEGLVVGLLDDRGSYDASTNIFPTTGGSGTGGAVLKGDLWYVSVAGTLGGKSVAIGDSFRALADTPGQTAGNWSILSANIGYVPENVSNKQNSLTVDATNLKYPTVTAVIAGLSLKATDSGVLHKTGAVNESFDGVKSSTNTGSGSQINGLALINNSATSSVFNLTNNANNTGATIANTSTGQGLYISSSGSGTGLLSVASGTGQGIRSAISGSNTSPAFSAGVSGSATGLLYEGRDSSTNLVYSVNPSGDITGRKFIKTGGLATEYLKADGSVSTLTNPITGGANPGSIPKMITNSTIGTSLIYDNGVNVGLGTTAPAVKLDVRGKIIAANTDFVLGSVGSLVQLDQGGATSGNTYSRIGAYNTGGTNPTNLILNGDGGNVGIGINSPNAKLDVSGVIASTVAGNPVFRLYSTDPNVNNRNWDLLSNVGNFGDFDIRVSIAQGLDPGLSVLKIKSSGNVLIGTTTDNGVDKLQVNGTISTKGIKIDVLLDSPDAIFINTPLSSQKTFFNNGDIGFGGGDYYIESFKFDNIDYGMQRITYISGALQNKIYVRSKSSTWSAWVEK